MLLDTRGIARATRCLWSLQEAMTEIEGLLVTQADGITITSTLRGVDSIQRLSAVTNTLFMLSEDVSEQWGRGHALEVRMRIKNPNASKPEYCVSIKPLTQSAVLTAVFVVNDNQSKVDMNIDLATDYLIALLEGDNPTPINWY
jgi:predicted regulator of Ras-like GTPase activity (Roadblock/LC7/MglB family)